jgi:hypothetical protein
MAKLIALPQWNPYRHALDCQSLWLELLTEEVRRTPRGPALKWTRRFSCRLSGAGPKVWRIHSTVLYDLRRVVATVDSFVQDHRAVLARSHDHCCICGRVLTDELSRSRGIGPECIHKTEWGAFLNAQSLIMPEEEQGTEITDSVPLVRYG